MCHVYCVMCTTSASKLSWHDSGGVHVEGKNSSNYSLQERVGVFLPPVYRGVCVLGERGWSFAHRGLLNSALIHLYIVPILQITLSTP